MTIDWLTGRDWRKARLFGPIIALTLGVLTLLVLTSALLVQRFDVTAKLREAHMVDHGFARQVEELDKVVATQVSWDDAILSLDHKRDADWADFNIGNYLYTFNGFTHAFVLDGQEQVFYASHNGDRAGLDAYAPFAPVAAQLIPAIRAAEQRRPPLRHRPGKGNIVVPPIQADTVGVIDGQVYIIGATLVQPDFGHVLPRGARAPIAITAIPIGNRLLGQFSQRYLLDGVKLVTGSQAVPGPGTLLLKDRTGATVAALKWTPRKPSAVLFDELLLPLLVALGLVCAVALTIMRRSGAVVSDLIASEARAKHLAFHDPLTRLPNRAMLFERLHTLLGRLGTRGGTVTVICVDLDRFKEINDTLGHHAGDLVIETMAVRLRSACPDAELIARLGGDEFVVLCTRSDCASAPDIGLRIRSHLAAPLQCEYGLLDIDCSIGVVVVDHAGVEPTEALRWADLALYRSKREGKGRVTLFRPEMDAALQDRRAMEADLRRALTDGGLSIVYQPQVDLQGRVNSVEALLRWTHVERGEVPPGLFIPLAEESGLILPLGEYVVRRVFAETGAWRRARVAINVSAEQMRAPGFAALVARLAAEAGISPTRYEIELTETALLGDEPVTVGNIEALKRLGFSFALDDFGTGYSSLSVLQRFSVDKIKIDRSFVSGLEADREAEALVDAMIRLARALELRVIAEGVESEAQRDQLVKCGCTEFQGYLVGRPMTLEQVAELAGEGGNAPPRRFRRAG